MAWSFRTEQEARAGSAPAGSCVAAFEENRGWCPWQTTWYRGERGLGSAEWILDSLESPGCVLGLEHHLSSVQLQQGDGLFSQSAVSWGIQLQLWEPAETIPDGGGLRILLQGWVSPGLSAEGAWAPSEMQYYGSSCTRLVPQYSKVLIARCSVVSKLEGTVRFT